MYKVNDYLVYNYSVCKVKEIKDIKDKKYYVLVPLSDESLTITSPTTQENVNIRPLLSKSEVKELFKKILNVINKFKKLQFDFCLGDLHEKNVIVDKDKNIHIIDPDGFIINNKKFHFFY